MRDGRHSREMVGHGHLLQKLSGSFKSTCSIVFYVPGNKASPRSHVELPMNLGFKNGQTASNQQSFRTKFRPDFGSWMPQLYYYPVIGRELRSVWGIHIPYIFPIKWGAKELLRVSEPSNRLRDLGRNTVL